MSRIVLRSSLFALMVFWLLTACTRQSLQRPLTRSYHLGVGENTIELIAYTSDEDPACVFVNVHEDEQTSIDALHTFSLDHRINYYRLHHSGERRIRFLWNDTLYDADPNRIFTEEGCRKTLETGGQWSANAQKKIRKFASALLSHITRHPVIVAMHNNTPDNYSILSYLPDSSEAQNTGRLYINDRMDPDDFIYTTHRPYFDWFAAQGVNVILQKTESFADDGSLSVYCGIHGIKYINIETEHGHRAEQIGLIGKVLELLSAH